MSKPDYHPMEMYPLVVCPGCKKSFHRINDNYDPDAYARGHMFTILPKFRRWDRFLERRETKQEQLICPGCGMRYSDKQGKVKLTGAPPPKPPRPEEPEPYEFAPPLHLQEPEPEPEKKPVETKKKKYKNGGNDVLGEIFS